MKCTSVRQRSDIIITDYGGHVGSNYVGSFPRLTSICQSTKQDVTVVLSLFVLSQLFIDLPKGQKKNLRGIYAQTQ